MSKKIIIAAEESALHLKEKLVAFMAEKGYDFTDATQGAMTYVEVGSAVGKAVSAKEYDLGIVLCGSGMGVNLVANRYSGVYCGLCESLHTAKMARTITNCNVLAMGGFYVAPQMGIEIAEAYLNHNLGDGYEWWPNFYEFHELAVKELEAFDYDKFKANGFKLEHLYEVDLPDMMNDRPE